MDKKTKRPKLTKKEEAIYIEMNKIRGAFFDYAERVKTFSKGATPESPIPLTHHKGVGVFYEDDFCEDRIKTLVNFIIFCMAKGGVKWTN